MPITIKELKEFIKKIKKIDKDSAKKLKNLTINEFNEEINKDWLLRKADKFEVIFETINNNHNISLSPILKQIEEKILPEPLNQILRSLPAKICINLQGLFAQELTTQNSAEYEKNIITICNAIPKDSKKDTKENKKFLIDRLYEIQRLNYKKVTKIVKVLSSYATPSQEEFLEILFFKKNIRITYREVNRILAPLLVSLPLTKFSKDNSEIITTEDSFKLYSIYKEHKKPISEVGFDQRWFNFDSLIQRFPYIKAIEALNSVSLLDQNLFEIFYKDPMDLQKKKFSILIITLQKVVGNLNANNLKTLLFHWENNSRERFLNIIDTATRFIGWLLRNNPPNSTQLLSDFLAKGYINTQFDDLFEYFNDSFGEIIPCFKISPEKFREILLSFSAGNIDLLTTLLTSNENAISENIDSIKYALQVFDNAKKTYTDQQIILDIEFSIIETIKKFLTHSDYKNKLKNQEVLQFLFLNEVHDPNLLVYAKNRAEVLFSYMEGTSSDGTKFWKTDPHLEEIFYKLKSLLGASKPEDMTRAIFFNEAIDKILIEGGSRTTLNNRIIFKAFLASLDPKPESWLLPDGGKEGEPEAFIELLNKIEHPFAYLLLAKICLNELWVSNKECNFLDKKQAKVALQKVIALTKDEKTNPWYQQAKTMQILHGFDKVTPKELAKADWDQFSTPKKVLEQKRTKFGNTYFPKSLDDTYDTVLKIPRHAFFAPQKSEEQRIMEQIKQKGRSVVKSTFQQESKIYAKRIEQRKERMLKEQLVIPTDDELITQLATNTKTN